MDDTNITPRHASDRKHNTHRVVLIVSSMVLCALLAWSATGFAPLVQASNFFAGNQVGQGMGSQGINGEANMPGMGENMFSQNTGAQSTDTVKSAGDGSITELLDTDDLFTERDLEQDPDLSDAVFLEVADNQDIEITQAGTYVLSGSAREVCITVDAAKEKVQLVLDGLSITNTAKPAIYVIAADKCFITTTDTTNTLTVQETIALEDAAGVDAVIFSKDDLVLNGQGTLVIRGSAANGVTSKDDLKVTGGSYIIEAGSHGLEANDSIRICAGTFDITAATDAIHCTNDEDGTAGLIYISDGDFTLTAASDGIEGSAFVRIDGGTFVIQADEGIEGTFVQINDGTISIEASDDGINASYKSSAYTPTIEVNGGTISIVMGAGDTDAFDSNGYLYINAGTITISAMSAFDYEYGAALNGGEVYVNGEQVTSLTQAMMQGGRGMTGGFR